MSEYEDLKGDLLTVMESVNGYGRSVNRYADVVNKQVAKLWEDNAELRDELHALANRVETLTRARLTEPAEVAERMTDTMPIHSGELPCATCGAVNGERHREVGREVFGRHPA